MNSVHRCAAALPLFLFMAGCGEPTAEDRDNRRVVECLLTAITLHNPRLLADGASWAARRHDAGHLTDEEYRGLRAIIDKARQGDWLAAEEDGYRFRELHPFVEPGH